MRGDQVVRIPASVQRLLAFVALRDGAVDRAYVAASLWPDVTDARASANLRSALWRLHALGPTLLSKTDDALVLAADVGVDVREATAAARRLLHGGWGDTADDPERILLAGELLPAWYEDWVLVDRERFRQLRLHALERLCEHFTARGRFAEATEAGLAAVAVEPLRESAQRSLVSTYLAEGNRSEALRQYESFRKLLDDELGVAPSPLMERLVSTLRRR